MPAVGFALEGRNASPPPSAVSSRRRNGWPATCRPRRPRSRRSGRTCCRRTRRGCIRRGLSSCRRRGFRTLTSRSRRWSRTVRYSSWPRRHSSRSTPPARPTATSWFPPARWNSASSATTPATTPPTRRRSRSRCTSSLRGVAAGPVVRADPRPPRHHHRRRLRVQHVPPQHRSPAQPWHLWTADSAPNALGGRRSSLVVFASVDHY